MPTWKQIVEKYGVEMATKMGDSGWLDNVMCTVLPSGEIDIPQRDIDLAFKSVNENEELD